MFRLNGIHIIASDYLTESVKLKRVVTTHDGRRKIKHSKRWFTAPSKDAIYIKGQNAVCMHSYRVEQLRRSVNE